MAKTKFNNEKQLKAKKLLSAYIKRLEKNSISYLKKDSKARNKIIKLISNLKKIRNGHDTNREQKQLIECMKIWKILVVRALKHISLSRVVRGFGKLYEYYEKSVSFEDLLFGIDSTYRDHTMHALWVYLLGDYFLNKKGWFSHAKIDWDIKLKDSDNTNNENGKSYKEDLELKLEEYKDSVFCIIALCHDLAYPFEKAEDINKKIKEMSDYLGIRSFEELQYKFSIEQSLLIKKLIQLCSIRLIIKNNMEIEFINDDPTFVDMSQSFEQRKHGILSSYLLYRLIDTMGEITFTKVQNLPNRTKTIKDLLIRRNILHAISSHTCDYAYSDTYNRFRFLLSLFDEIEEFSRYKRVGRSNIDEICYSNIEFKEPGKFLIIYRFTKDHEADPKKFFIERAIRFCSMVDIDEENEFGIKEFILSCIDEKTSKKENYSLEINKEGIFYISTDEGSKKERLDPDPENKLREKSVKLKHKKVKKKLKRN